MKILQNLQHKMVIGGSNTSAFQPFHKSNKIDSSTIFIGNSVDNCVVIRKTTFLSVKGFDSNLSKLGLEDWSFDNIKEYYKFCCLNNYHLNSQNSPCHMTTQV